jgi:rhamnogalacturonyl hydrolase YesR
MNVLYTVGFPHFILPPHGARPSAEPAAAKSSRRNSSVPTMRVGLPGYTHNQKISCHRMWQDMATLFVTELGDVTDFPEDFAGMLRYLADYEAVDYEYSP